MPQAKETLIQGMLVKWSLKTPQPLQFYFTICVISFRRETHIHYMKYTFLTRKINGSWAFALLRRNDLTKL